MDLHKKKKQTESRLGNLLSKIRCKKEETSIEKEKRVNIKWKQYDPVKKTENTVTQKCGGGHRFIAIGLKETVKSIKEKAIALYFPGDVNYFGEFKKDCQFKLTDAAGNEIDDSFIVLNYVKERGIYISKFFFVIVSKLQ